MDTKRPLWPGWETTRLIGRGSFGGVYEIERKLFEDDEPEKAALKVIAIPQNDSDIEELYSDGYDDESITSAFKSHLKSIVAEYSLMRKMNGSANIVSCDDIRYIQHEDGIGWDIYIKMELLIPLAKALPAEIPEDQIIGIAKDMCAALELCSEYNIVHRDIKPQNIFVSKHGDYKLGDFGIAKTVEKTMGGTKTGTYKYMAPEVYNNKPYGASADIYSLGLVLYWMLNERRMPFMPLPPEKLKAGMDEESRNRRFSGEKIPAPKNGSKELKTIILKACAFDPKDRYTSAKEMREDLLHISGENSVACQSIFAPVIENCDDDKTVGPEFNQGDNKIEQDVFDQDDEKAVGSIFNPGLEKRNTNGHDKTVNPVSNERKIEKIIWPLFVFAGCLLVMLVLVLFTLNKNNIPTITQTDDGKQTITTEIQSETNPQIVTEAVTEHVHDWGEATCIVPQTCSICAETTGSVAEHTWIAGTCMEADVCAVCAETGILQDHQWSEEGSGEIKLCDWCGMLSVPENFSVEEKVGAVSKAFSEIVGLDTSGMLTKTRLSNDGYIFTDTSGQIRIIVVYPGTDGIGAYSQSYRREYYFDGGELVFALYEGKDAHRLYFYGGRLFRWRYTAGGASTNYDLEFGETYRMWEQYAINECKMLYPGY